jgi:hypothetical protein
MELVDEKDWKILRILAWIVNSSICFGIRLCSNFRHAPNLNDLIVGVSPPYSTAAEQRKLLALPFHQPLKLRPYRHEARWASRPLNHQQFPTQELNVLEFATEKMIACNEDSELFVWLAQ